MFLLVAVSPHPAKCCGGLCRPTEGRHSPDTGMQPSRGDEDQTRPETTQTAHRARQAAGEARGHSLAGQEGAAHGGELRKRQVQADTTLTLRAFSIQINSPRAAALGPRPKDQVCLQDTITDLRYWGTQRTKFPSPYVPTCGNQYTTEKQLTDGGKGKTEKTAQLQA